MRVENREMNSVSETENCCPKTGPKFSNAYQKPGIKIEDNAQFSLLAEWLVLKFADPCSGAAMFIMT